jgi:hypothetical protein
MDTSFENSPTEYGRPLYHTCFSHVAVTLVQARGLLPPPASLAGHGASSSGSGETYLIVDLVDADRCKPCSDVWRHRSKGHSSPAANAAAAAKSVRSLRDLGGGFAEPFFGEEVRWDDVSVPFEKAAVRIRLFEVVHAGKDAVLGTAVVRLLDLEETLRADAKKAAARVAEGGKQHGQGTAAPSDSGALVNASRSGASSGGPGSEADRGAALRARGFGASQSASVLNGADEWLAATPLEAGALETWWSTPLSQAPRALRVKLETFPQLQATQCSTTQVKESPLRSL